MTRNYAPSIWDDTGALDLLTKLWIDGLPTRPMAARLTRYVGSTVTHNAIIGKVHRLGLHVAHPRSAEARGDAASYASRARGKQAKKAKQAGKPAVPPSVPIIADVSNARPWLERERGQCAFPLGLRGAVMSCCAPTEETYCPSHRKAMGGARKPWTGTDHVRPQAHPQERRETPLFERFTGAEAA